MSNLLYDALMLGRNKQIANEEFQVATGRKEAASFKIAEEDVNISNVISNGVFSMHIIQESPGYLEIEVSCSDDFIIFDRKNITSDEFADSQYTFNFMVLSDRLHNGKNFSSICFRTAGQSIEVPVSIDNKIRVILSDVNPRKSYADLNRVYLDMKTEKIPVWQWAQESLDLLGDVHGTDVETLFLMLYKAQIYMTQNDDEHARNYIEHVGTQIPKLERKNYDLYCFFIYQASLYEEVENVCNSADPGADFYGPAGTGDIQDNGRKNIRGNDVMDMSALEKVHWVYSHYPSWRILWILFYMDPAYRSDLNLMMAEMQDMFYRGWFISPVMYVEALKIFDHDVSMMQEFGQFELQVLIFGMKYACLTADIARRAAQLILEDDINAYPLADKLLSVRVLEYAYNRFHDSQVLIALLKMLASAGLRDSSYHSYFRKGYELGYREEYILEYYIYTIDRSLMDPIPSEVLDYFTEHTELLYDCKEYIYANIVSNKYSDPGHYQSSLDTIIKYAEFQTVQDCNNESLSVIYKDILDNDRLTPVMKNNMFDVLCIKEIVCHNKRMRSVLVFHRELQVYQESALQEGRCFIKIYSHDALILFKDDTGNLYHNIRYTVNQLIEVKEYIDVCIKDAGINKYMLIGDTFPLLRVYKSPTEILEFFTSYKFPGTFRHAYEQELLAQVISYYAKNSRDEQVYDELLKLRDYELSSKSRGILIDVMIRQGLVDDAFDEIREFGKCDLSDKSLAQMAHTYIEKHGDHEDELLTSLCEAGYRADGFDELIFNYMYNYYNGSIDVLIELYRSCNAYGKDSSLIEERILLKAIRTGKHPEVVSYVFKRYYAEGNNTELIKRYMEFRAGRYLYDIMKGIRDDRDTADMSFFDLMEEEMYKGRNFNDESIIAYILFRTGLEQPDERQLRNIESRLKELVRRGKMLEEFKYYRKFFTLPSTLENYIIISAFCEEQEKIPVISYEIRGSGKTVSGLEEMEEIFTHCYVKYFTLFYGEKVIFAMDGRESTEVAYQDLEVRTDGSRYSVLNEMIKLRSLNDKEGFCEKAGEFYIKEQLIDILF